MKNGFFLSNAFGEKYLRFTNPEYLKVYLYLAYITQKTGSFPAPQTVAKELDLPLDRVTFILDFWVNREELIAEKGSFRFPEKADGKDTPRIQASRKRASRPSYSMEEIDGAAVKNQQVSDMFHQAEAIFSRVLTLSEMEMLYSFMDWLGLPPEVITMLLSYGAKVGKTNRRYLETVAIDWAERGIDTFEAAEAHVKTLEQADMLEHQFCRILGIYDRALTATEKKYIKRWGENSALNAELVSLAYDRTVTHTGKRSLAYMDKILESWVLQGATCEEDVLKQEENKGGYGQKPTLPKKGPLANYDDTNTTDYAGLEEKLLDLMLDEEE